MRLSAAEIHARVLWPEILVRLGVGEQYLRKQHGPCPACGGKDRFRFDNRFGKGGFFCNGCGAGDGFELVMRVNRWGFAEARQRVIEAAGLSQSDAAVVASMPAKPTPVPASARPTSRCLRLRRESCDLALCDAAVAYLECRGLWPMPEGVTLRAHATAEYFDFDSGQKIGRYPALVADIRDIADDLVTLHVTYLEGGKKLASHEPRKILSPLTGRESCAVRLMPLAGDTLGIAEGIESAASAALVHREAPVWAALNTSLLAKFSPPGSITRLIVYADRDVPGMLAAAKVMERLQGSVRVEIKAPTEPFKDWNDVLMSTRRRTL